MRALPRLPLGSDQPVRAFAAMRLAITGVAAVAVAVIAPPHAGRLVAALVCLGVPWGLGVLVLARSAPERAMSLPVAVGDLAVLALIEALVPESYGAVRFAAFSFLAVHAHFQGAARGAALAACGAGTLTACAAIWGSPLPERLFLLYDAVFVAGAVAASALMGSLRTSESAQRLRARGLTLRALEDEGELRRRLSESIHDGPIQDLIALDMILAAAMTAGDRGDHERERELVEEARGMATRNVDALREEIVSLGPDAFQEVMLDTALENARLTWERRYGVSLQMNVEPVELEPGAAGDLFRIAQEAVVNAGRHARAATVSVSLRDGDHEVLLSVADDGKGFDRSNPRAQTGKVGHLGLASMRGRALLLGATLDIETGNGGTTVRVRAPRTPGSPAPG